MSGQQASPEIPYGRHWVTEEDIQAVAEVLRSAWLTTGPKVAELERAFALEVGAAEAVAVSNGTAALHAMMHAIGIGPGDEVIVPTLTFVASANAVLYQGGRPVLVDVDPERLLIDLDQVAAMLTPKTKAVLAVDYSGHPCDYDELRSLVDARGLTLLADACHALGGSYRGRSVGSLADLSTFSLHAVKHITSAEGGMVVTQDPELAARMRAFRNHGMSRDRAAREREASWYYEMRELGFNYRLTDVQCALALSQLPRLREWVTRRQQIATRYDEAFTTLAGARPLNVDLHVSHAYHIYVIQLLGPDPSQRREAVFRALRAEGIGVNVHYLPVHLHAYYRENLGTARGSCPVAEDAYERMLTLPMFPGLSDSDVERVIEATIRHVNAHAA